MPIIIYRDPKQQKRNSWIKYFLNRIKSNKNNLIVVTGATGSGKTWSAMSICEIMSKGNGVPFIIDNIVFSLKDLMLFLSSEKAVKGACIIFDEPQITISSRESMSEVNRVFNYLLTTFRHRNLTLFFCTPYEDLLDKTARKLFHAKFETTNINFKEKTVRLKPKTIEYNAQKQKFYEKYLRVCYKPEERTSYITRKLNFWDIPKPSEDLIKQYEAKKDKFTSDLNIEILKRLERHEAKTNPKPLTQFQQRIKEECWDKGISRQVDIAEHFKVSQALISMQEGWMAKKGVKKPPQLTI